MNFEETNLMLHLQLSFYFFLFVLCFSGYCCPFFIFIIGGGFHSRERKGIKQSWAATKVFDTCFCVIFDCYRGNFISAGETGCWALYPANFETCLIFPNFLSFVWELLRQLLYSIFILDINYHFTCGESKFF